jgi:hypothetical protein
VLKDKIPPKLLAKIKNHDSRMNNKSDPDYGINDISPEDEFSWTMAELIEEAHDIFVKYKEKNPTDESNADCQDLFEEWDHRFTSESGCDCEHVCEHEDKQTKTKKKKKKKKNKNKK